MANDSLITKLFFLFRTNIKEWKIETSLGKKFLSRETSLLFQPLKSVSTFFFATELSSAYVR